ncbi:hypothetical protein KUTeg_009283 [Tegillarca granosa]|uniref:Uncharacterized protein n=1 Tax=Tegillarca granosa TaxID=220873 RepID=A0ABQ9FBE2_TEGGR|nr:hypothetical protein KUTeg_009283 [Tegillarca granosa]
MSAKGTVADAPISPKSKGDTTSSAKASNDQINMSNSNSNSNKLDKLIDAKSSQDSMERMFESKLDKLKSDLMTNVSEKVRALRDELSIDIGRET